MAERAEQMLTNVTCDTRLDLALDAAQIAQEALTAALDLITEIIDGNDPEIAGLDDKIMDALDAINEVLDENFSIRTRKRMMKRLIRYIEK